MTSHLNGDIAIIGNKKKLPPNSSQFSKKTFRISVKSYLAPNNCFCGIQRQKYLMNMFHSKTSTG